MLMHSCICWDIIILAPATEGMEEEDWVLIAELEELLAGILKQKDVSIVKWVSYLECINCISSLGLNLSVDLSWGKSKVVNAIVEGHSLKEVHAGTGDKEVALAQDVLSLGVLC